MKTNKLIRHFALVISNVISTPKDIKTFLRLVLSLIITVNCLLILPTGSYSQNIGVGINTAGVPANASAILDVSSTTQGTLITRMNTAQRNAISSPAESLLIYNTDTHCFEAYYNGAWISWGCLNGCQVPAQPSSVAGTGSVCQSQSGVAFSVTNVSGVSYTWAYSGTGFTLASGSGTNSISADFSATATSGTLSVTGSNACGGSPARTLALSVNTMPQGSLTANGPFCTTGAGQLTWTASAGTGSYTVVYNDGTANRTASGVGSGTPFAVFTTPVTTTTAYTLVSVTDANCIRSSGFTGSSATITVNAAPAQPGAITGTTPICKGQTGVYYGVTNVSGVTYTWAYSGTGFSIEAGCNNCYYILADFTTSVTSGTLSVTPSNACGTGTSQTLAITLMSAPSLPPTCGTQIWATANSNYGTQTTNATQSLGQKWCYNNVASNCTTYGGLYQWATAMNGGTSTNCNPCGSGGVQGICDAGYHIPTDYEWAQYEYCVENTIAPTGSTSLATFQTGMGNVGSTTTGVGPDDKLRATICDGWAYSTSNNSSGFTGLPGGWASGGNNGDGQYLGSSAFFWTATQYDATYAWMRSLSYAGGNTSQVYRWDNNKPFGHSVRCLKN